LVLFQWADDRAQQRIEPSRFCTVCRDLNTTPGKMANISPFDTNAPFFEEASDRDEQSMLVNNIELMQTPERVPMRFPSGVWLDTPDRLCNLLPQNSV
jgi:hypothetical protein